MHYLYFSITYLAHFYFNKNYWMLLVTIELRTHEILILQEYIRYKITCKHCVCCRIINYTINYTHKFNGVSFLED